MVLHLGEVYRGCREAEGEQGKAVRFLAAPRRCPKGSRRDKFLHDRRDQDRHQHRGVHRPPGRYRGAGAPVALHLDHRWADLVADVHAKADGGPANPKVRQPSDELPIV